MISQPAQPEVSVILPCYDGVDADLLELAIHSILRQSFADFELLLYMDGVRKEAIRRLVVQARQEDGRVRVLDRPKNATLAESLNCLIAESRGQFIARMDADDISLPDRFQEQVDYLHDHPDTAAVGCFADEVDLQGVVTFRKTLPSTHDDIVRFMTKRDPFIHPTMMFRRDFLHEVGLYSTRRDDHLIEDTELWARSLERGYRFANIPKVLYLFRVSNAMFRRRGGIRRALRESGIRWRYALRTRQPLHTLAFPAAVFAVRMSPPWAIKLMYRYLR